MGLRSVRHIDSIRVIGIAKTVPAWVALLALRCSVGAACVCGDCFGGTRVPVDAGEATRC